MSDNPTVYLDEDGVPHYRASALGSCLRSLVAQRMGYDPVPIPGYLEKIFNAGHRSEDACLAALRSAGWTIAAEQETVRLDLETSFGPVVVEGHIDGVGARDERERILEIKSQGPSAWDAFEKTGYWRKELAAHYDWQASVYMLAKGVPLSWVRWLRGKEGEPDPGTWAIFEVNEPPRSLVEITARLETIEGLAANAELPSCGDDFSKQCTLYYLHDEQEELETLSGLSSLAKRYDDARQREAEAKKDKEAVKEEIVSLLGTQQLTKAVEGPAKATLSSYERKVLDEKAMVRDGIDVDRYKVTRGYQSLRVTYKS